MAARAAEAKSLVYTLGGMSLELSYANMIRWDWVINHVDGGLDQCWHSDCRFCA